MKSGSTFTYIIALVAFIMILGLILRYGKSSHLLYSDTNTLVGLLTLQNPNATYYGPQ